MWQFTTPILDPEQALMIAGLLAGNGHHFGYDVDAFDLKGFGPLDPATANVYTLRKGATELVPQPSEFNMKYGGAVAVENASTNLFVQNVRTGTDTLSNTTGFTAIDAPGVFQSLDVPALGQGWVTIQGVRVLEFTSALAVNGVRGGIKTNGFVGVAATTYTASVWVQADGAVRCQLKDVTNGVNGTIQTVTPPGLGTQYWQRISSTVTTGGAVPTLEFEVLEDVADTGINVWCDRFQLEVQPGPTSWFDGARGAGLLRCDVQSFVSSGRTISEDIRTAVDLTVMLWINKGDDRFPIDRRTLWYITEDFLGNPVRGHYLGLEMLAGGGLGDAISLEVQSGGMEAGGSSASTPVVGASTLALNTWMHVALVMRRNSVFGADLNKLKLYVNGALSAQSLMTGPLETMPNLGKTNALYLGTRGAQAARFNGGLMDDLVVVPYAMTAAGISAVFGAGRAFSDLPRLDAEGAGIVTGPPRAIVLGELPSGEFVQAHFSATVTQNARTVDITLTEV
jgi:hypothetical protein